MNNPLIVDRLRLILVRLAAMFTTVNLMGLGATGAEVINDVYLYDSPNRMSVIGNTTYQRAQAGNLVQMITPITLEMFCAPITKTLASAVNSSTSISLTAFIS